MRILFVLALALSINFGLFVLMDNMISRENSRVVELLDTQAIEFLRTEMDEETRTRDRRTPPPPKPQEIQRPRAEVANIVERVSSLPTDVAAYEVTSLLAEGGAGVALAPSLVQGDEGFGGLDIMMADDLVPLTMLPPQYPPAARMRDIEGWVELLFTVTSNGTVADPVVIDSQPGDIFDRAALEAARRWRFRPVSRNGEAIDILARIHINFSLENQ